MNFTRTAILLFLLHCCFNTYAQTDTSFLNKAVTGLEKYSATNPVEKVHLHLDRTNYTPGDTIWFKAYTVAGQNHGLSAISKILHVELLTGYDSVVNRIAIPLSDGVGWADFALPVLIKTGSYHVRAYTNWMRNYAPDYFFDQAIQIKEIEAATTKQKKQKATGEPDVQFFAEGGALVNGLRTKIALKAVGTNGMGEDVDGSVTDNDGNEVAVFSTQHLGMGVFALIPQAGKTYKVKITRKNGDQFTARLPKALDDGFAIAVNNAMPDSISIRVASSPKLFETKKGAKYYLVGQSGGKIYFTASLTLSSPSFSTRIDKKRFPTGIAQFTLFAENGEPLNERIIFIRHDDGLKLKVTSAKKAYGVRQKVDITLNALSNSDKPAIGSFSATVINGDITNDESSKNTILSNLLLRSDLKGDIENPGYYFCNITDKTQSDLDLLMLTQGYRSFEWQNVLSGKYPQPVFDPETSLTVTGYLKSYGGKPIIKGKVLMYKTKGGWFRLDTMTNDNGKFVFKGLIPDADTTLRYVIQGRTGVNKKNLMISVDTIAPFKKMVSHNVYTANNDTLSVYQKLVNQQLKVSLDRRLISLKEVVIKAEKEPARWGNMNPDQALRGFPKEASGERLSDYLSARVRGVIFINGLPYSSRQPKDVMGILLDGSVVPPELFQTILASDIEAIDVLRTKGKEDILTGMQNVLVITSKHGNGLYTKEEVLDVMTYASNGLYKSREFYSPKYDGPKIPMQSQDLRQTICWKPDIITDKNGNATLTFYNADTRGIYQVTIEGVDVDGNLGRQVYTYTVE